MLHPEAVVYSKEWTIASSVQSYVGTDAIAASISGRDRPRTATSLGFAEQSGER